MRLKAQEVSTTDSPRVKSSIPVRGNFLLYFFALIEIWQIWQNDLFTDQLDCIEMRED